MAMVMVIVEAGITINTRGFRRHAEYCHQASHVIQNKILFKVK